MSSFSRRDALKALGALPIAASTSAQTSTQSGKKVLRYAFEVAETGFDPVSLSDLYSRIVTSHIFDGLYRYDYLARPFKILPCTADGMPEVSEDFRTWTVRLKRGIYFQDDAAFKGQRKELIAQDYVYSWKRFFDPRWKAPAFASLNDAKMLGMTELREAALKSKKPFDYDSEVEGMRAVDRYTLLFRLADPNPRFIETMADNSLWGAVAREVVEAYGDDIPAHPVGTGPFALVEWRRSSRIVLERNPTYREITYEAEPNADDAEGQALLQRFRGRRLPMIDRVEISIIEEVQPRWLSFLNKQSDVSWLVPYDFVNIAAPNGKLAPFLAKQDVRLYRTLASDVTYTYFNMEDATVGGYSPEKVALRRAIGLAIDIDQEIRLFWRGQAVPAHSPLMPNTVGYDKSYFSINARHDVAEARSLLDLFGYIDRDGDGWRELPDGSPLVLQWATTPDQRSRQRDELRRKDMNSIGIKVEFTPAKWPENLKSARAGRLMVWNIGLSAASPDGRPSLDAGSTTHKGGQNLARFDNRRFDDIYQRIRVLPNGEERDQLFFEGKRLLSVYVPYKHHVHRILTDLTWPWVAGFRRPPYWRDWWPYVDIDVEQQASAIA
ncbi:MAG: ABC transporter substrate-binding protein [Pseudomonadota bacterium]|nr:ABC transporter substrate-binding protein [Pseudomonadota bacterium]